MKTCSCGQHLTEDTVTWIGIQHAPGMALRLYNCPYCRTTGAIRLTPGQWLEQLPLYNCPTCSNPTIFKAGCVECEEKEATKFKEAL